MRPCLVETAVGAGTARTRRVGGRRTERDRGTLAAQSSRNIAVAAASWSAAMLTAGTYPSPRAISAPGQTEINWNRTIAHGSASERPRLYERRREAAWRTVEESTAVNGGNSRPLRLEPSLPRKRALAASGDHGDVLRDGAFAKHGSQRPI